MPFISVVVPVLDGAGRCSSGCVEALLESTADLEVILAGPTSDNSFLRDPRVRVVPVAGRLEAGPAWAAGFEAAAGEYAWFVDTDGAPVPGAIAAIADRLAELRPDLLLIGHDRPSWTGAAPVLTPAAPGVFTVADRPDAFAAPPVAWGRIVHRDLIARAGFPFHPGRYPDVAFSYPLLVAAERIAVLDRVCYHHHERPPEPPTNGSGRAVFEIFDQYERLYALLDRWGVDGREARDRGDVQARIAERMMVQYWWLLADSGRVPAHLERAFFARMSEHQQRYLPPSPRAGHGLDDLHRSLVARDRWRTYVALRSVRQFTRTAGERIRQAAAPNAR